MYRVIAHMFGEKVRFQIFSGYNNRQQAIFFKISGVYFLDVGD